MQRFITRKINCGDKTCEGCDLCNGDCSPAECTGWTVPRGEGRECVPLVWSDALDGWKRHRACLAAERKEEG